MTSRRVTVLVAAQHVGVHPDTIRRWIRDGILTGYKLGPRLTRVDLDDLDQIHRPMPSKDQQ